MGCALGGWAGPRYHRGWHGSLQLPATGKSYRALGTDIHADYNPFEAGLEWAVRPHQDDFKGKAALLKIKEKIKA